MPMRSPSPTPTATCFSFLPSFTRSKKTAEKDAPSADRVASSTSTSASPAYRPTSSHTDDVDHDLYGCCLTEIPPPSLVGSSEGLPAYGDASESSKSEFGKTVHSTIASYDGPLRELSLFISDHPELSFREFKAHDKITAFLEKEGFDVERSYGGMKTAFRATFILKGDGLKPERSFGLNSEYDALPGVGHACGHNLIAIAGVAALLGVRAGMKKHNVPGRLVLIGTPAEEGGSGKVRLLEMGAYNGLDACMMVHPGPGGPGVAQVGGSLAIQVINVEFFGKTAHAALEPWEGINALDAANLAYSSISALRQQMNPTERVHGIITDGGLAPNIIPDHSAMRYYVRAPTAKAVEKLTERVLKSFEAAALATGCTAKITPKPIHKDLRNNDLLAREYQSAMSSLYGTHVTVDPQAGGGSTDFGNVTYALPSCHPSYGIRSPPGGGNHTALFTTAARTSEAHQETLKSAVGIACAGMRVLADGGFTNEVRAWWEEDMRSG